MDATVLAALRSLLDTERVLTVAVLVDGQPVAAMLPYAVADDRTTLYVQASQLARHTAGLRAGSAGVVIHQPATPDRDPMQLPRLTVQAAVQVVARDSEAFNLAAGRLIERCPAAATTLALADFDIYAFTLGRGRYIEGFARAFNVHAETFKALG